MAAGDVSVSSRSLLALRCRSSMDLDPPQPPASASAAPPASSAHGLDALELLASAAGAAEPSPVAAYAPVASTSAMPAASPSAGKVSKAKKPRASKPKGENGPGKGWRKGLKGAAAVKLEDGVASAHAGSPTGTPELEDPSAAVEKKPAKKRAAPGQSKRALAAKAIPKLSTEGTGGAVATAPQPTRIFPVGPMPKVRLSATRAAFDAHHAPVDVPRADMS